MLNFKRPAMILFDYGQTLMREPDFSALRGERALFGHIAANPRGITAEQADALACRLYAEAGRAREAGFEVSQRQLLALKTELLGLEYDVPMDEAELIYWDGASPGELMPGVAEMLAGVAAMGLRTGVVSNIAWSGAALGARLRRALPEHSFDLVIASSECGVRKPSADIFALALSRAGMGADSVWYCGDSPLADVEGAAGAGIFPIWYQSPPNAAAAEPRCGHIRMTHWRELTALLERARG